MLSLVAQLGRDAATKPGAANANKVEKYERRMANLVARDLAHRLGKLKGQARKAPKNVRKLQ
jgi:hypothetical protein